MKKYLSKLTLISILLFTASIASAQNPDDQAAMLQDLGQMMGKMQQQIKANPNMSEEQQKELMMQMMSQSKTGQGMLQKQKTQLPKVLEVLKSNRECLAKADTKADAKACEKNSEKLAKKLGLEEDFEGNEEDFVWNKNTKKEALSEMDEGIKELEKALPCIKKANNMSDMMKCQGMQ